MDLIVMNGCRPCTFIHLRLHIPPLSSAAGPLLTSLHLSRSYCHAVLPDRWYCRALKLCNAPWNAMKHLERCRQVSVLLKNCRMWFQWLCMLGGTFVWGDFFFPPWLRKMPLGIWDDMFSHTALFLSSPQFGPLRTKNWLPQIRPSGLLVTGNNTMQRRHFNGSTVKPSFLLACATFCFQNELRNYFLCRMGILLTLNYKVHPKGSRNSCRRRDSFGIY